MPHASLSSRGRARTGPASFLHAALAAAVVCGLTGTTASATPTPAATATTTTTTTAVTSTPAPTLSPREEEALRRSTAVTLNYCRASFYRIQKSPRPRVLVEEQEKILNNLDLNSIADQDVVKLYTGVLVEISEVRMSDRERHVLNEKYRTGLGTLLTGDALDFGTQVASAQYLSAIRTGARSWWDYRNSATVLDSDIFHADQKRLMTVTEKTGQFLDTFWKLARDRKIPDRWLVRNQDLSRLDTAMQERDLTVRLRVLRRMREFMECYPPYWYYLGRTHQALGQFNAAVTTYEKLVCLGQGHFRKDEMLAAGLANQAVIEEYLRHPCAAKTALKALGYSTDVWEANLMCARVLAQHGKLAEAEDAVLRNLDVDLERVQSTAALVSLYARQGRVGKLRSRLATPELVRAVPMPFLIRAAAVLGPQRLPESIVAHWGSSLAARYELTYGPDDFVLVTTPLWNLQTSEMSLVVGEESFRQSTIALSPGQSEVRFGRIGDVGHPLYASSSPPPAVLIVKYPDAPIVRLRFEPRPDSGGGGGGGATSALSNFPMVNFLTSASLKTRPQKLALVSIQIGETEFPLSGRSAAAASGPNTDADDSPTSPGDAAVPSPDKSASPSGAGVAGPAMPTAPTTEPPPRPTTQPATVPEPPVPHLAPPLKFPVGASAEGPKLMP
jgi:tetratricopeptide (TPR) repeat protein